MWLTDLVQTTHEATCNQHPLHVSKLIFEKLGSTVLLGFYSHPERRGERPYNSFKVKVKAHICYNKWVLVSMWATALCIGIEHALWEPWQRNVIKQGLQIQVKNPIHVQVQPVLVKQGLGLKCHPIFLLNYHVFTNYHN